MAGQGAKNGLAKRGGGVDGRVGNRKCCFLLPQVGALTKKRNIFETLIITFLTLNKKKIN